MNEWAKEKLKYDELIPLSDWEWFEGALRHIKEQAKGKLVLLDMHVHGYEEGLALAIDDINGRNIKLDNATFGYVINRIQKVFKPNEVVVLIESCEAGRAYKYTIRGKKYDLPSDNAEDCPTIPRSYIAGSGNNFNVVGNVMYIQFLKHDRYWWEDLRDYDPQGKNKPLLPIEKRTVNGSQPTTEKIRQYYRNFLRSLP